MFRKFLGGILIVGIILAIVGISLNVFLRKVSVQHVEPSEIVRFESESQKAGVYIKSKGYSRLAEAERIYIGYWDDNVPWRVPPIYMDVYNDEPLSKDNFMVQWEGEKLTLVISGNKQCDIVLELSEGPQWENAHIEYDFGYEYEYINSRKVLSKALADDGMKYLYVFQERLIESNIRVVLGNTDTGEEIMIKSSVNNDLGGPAQRSNCLTYWEGDTAVVIFNGEEQAECIMRISFGE